MIVIADTSPINYLVLMGAVDILPQLYGRVLLPQAVLRELGNPGASSQVRAWVASLPDWIAVVAADASDMLELPRLGPGEVEAITLGITHRADLVLMDDGPARKVAAARGLTVTGTLGVLKDASIQELLDFRESVASLRRLGFRMTDALVEEMSAED